MTVKTYDSKCYELAEWFLDEAEELNTKSRRHDLALTIQQAIEDWFESARDNYEPPNPPGWEGGFADNH